ncbi:glucans biosynthesis glucosyltransferase MdoH [Roseomonas sp. BN140053]|uniref:glucans biosynthesis glucosyltransferase MdoH n=1 Tax=Roseomonas sp. BN140053 TaxID=3391898 RepID=UPI0039EC2FA4
MPAEAIPLRRGAFVLLCALLTAGLGWLLLRVLAPGGWTGWEVLLLLGWLGGVPWLAISGANGLIGFAILLLSRDPAALVVPQLRHPAPRPPGLRTAILICVRDEDMEAVLPPVERLVRELEAAGAGEAFAVWFLSDTTGAAGAAREAAAVAALAAARAGRPPALHYRRRTENTGFKAGNVMDFLDRHAAGLDLFLCLDADSEMSAVAVLRLVGCMEADPRLAILQPLIVGRPARAAFPRLFQFGMRAGMRAWATGQAWWQGDAGPYWGHNAVARIAPFRDHARLAPLPDGSAILSHDQVEAARLTAAGWKVRCLPEAAGSLEGNPPALPPFLARDRRWGAGNMQYRHLLLRPGLSGMGRWQLLQAMLLFLTAPLWWVVLLAAVGNAATRGGAATPPGALGLVLAAHWLCAYAPKLLGYAEVLLRPGRASRYGGRGRFAAGALLEIAFTQLLDPVSLLNKALLLPALVLGRDPWAPQQRGEAGVRWGDALRLLWPHTLIGLGCAAALATASGTALAWGLPFLLGPVLSVPFCVWTAGPALSAALREGGIAATPEEVAGRAGGRAGLSPPPAG